MRTLQGALRAVELIPRGRVISYGDLGGLVGISARQAGWVMSRHGHEVAWWRVTNAQGELPASLLDEARACWAEEGIEIKPHGRGCRLDSHRADLVALASAWDAQLAADQSVN